MERRDEGAVGVRPPRGPRLARVMHRHGDEQAEPLGARGVPCPMLAKVDAVRAPAPSPIGPVRQQQRQSARARDSIEAQNKKDRAQRT